MFVQKEGLKQISFSILVQTFLVIFLFLHTLKNCKLKYWMGLSWNVEFRLYKVQWHYIIRGLQWQYIFEFSLKRIFKLLVDFHPVKKPFMLRDLVNFNTLSRIAGRIAGVI